MNLSRSTAFSALATILEHLHQGIWTLNTSRGASPVRPLLPRGTRIRGIRQQAIATQLRTAYLELISLAGQVERNPGLRLADGPLKGVPLCRRKDVVRLCRQLAQRVNRLMAVVPPRERKAQVVTLGWLHRNRDFKEGIEAPYLWADTYLQIWRLQGTVSRPPTQFPVESTQRRGLATLLKLCRVGQHL